MSLDPKRLSRHASCASAQESQLRGCAGDATAPSRGSGHGACEPFLCKIEPAIQDSCMVYNNGPDNIGVGSINIGPSPKYDACCILSS